MNKRKVAIIAGYGSLPLIGAKYVKEKTFLSLHSLGYDSKRPWRKILSIPRYQSTD